MIQQPYVKTKIKEFTDLIVWQEGHKLVLLIYEITGKFPMKEKYSLIDQMRRAVTSITSNIAEGFGRHSYREKTQFYYLSQGSLTELKNQLLIARDIKYFDEKTYLILSEKANFTHQLLQGLIKKTKSFIL
ncbi:MAG: four helix bundle protein [Patescibacteria group bacterium]